MCKKLITNSQPFVKKWKNVRSTRGGFFFDSHCSSGTTKWGVQLALSSEINTAMEMASSPETISRKRFERLNAWGCTDEEEVCWKPSLEIAAVLEGGEADRMLVHTDFGKKDCWRIGALKIDTYLFRLRLDAAVCTPSVPIRRPIKKPESVLWTQRSF